MRRAAAEAEAFLPMMSDAGAEEVFNFPEVAFVEADVIPSYTTFRRRSERSPRQLLLCLL